MRTTWKVIAVSLLAILGMIAVATPAQAADSKTMSRTIRGATGAVHIATDHRVQIGVKDTETDGHRAVGVLYLGTKVKECHNTAGNGGGWLACYYPAPTLGTKVSFRVDVREGSQIIRSSTFIVGTYGLGKFKNVHVP